MVFQFDQFLEISNLRDAQLLGALRTDLGRVAVDRLPAAENKVVTADGANRLGENIACGERVAGRRAAIGEQNGPVGPAIKAIAEHVGRSGWAHRQRGHRATVQVADFQRRFQGVKVLRVENRGKCGAIDRSVFLHGLGRDIGRIRHLFDANYTVVGHWSTLTGGKPGGKALKLTKAGRIGQYANKSMFQSAHATATLAHAAAAGTAGKFPGLSGGMGRRHAERLRQMRLAAGRANRLLLAPDQEFKIAPAILAGVFVNRHRIGPFQ